MTAADAGDRARGVISRVTEIMMSLPGTVIILAVIGAVGTNIPLIMAILGVLISAGIYRVMLGQAKSLQSQLYVDAAKVDGLGPAAASASATCCPGWPTPSWCSRRSSFAVGMLIQAGLAFIGFGPPIPQPSWGGMIQGASQHVYDAPWLHGPHRRRAGADRPVAPTRIGNALRQGARTRRPHTCRRRPSAASAQPMRQPRRPPRPPSKTCPPPASSASAASRWGRRRHPAGHGRLLRRRSPAPCWASWASPAAARR